MSQGDFAHNPSMQAVQSMVNLSEFIRILEVTVKQLQQVMNFYGS